MTFGVTAKARAEYGSLLTATSSLIPAGYVNDGYATDTSTTFANASFEDILTIVQAPAGANLLAHFSFDGSLSGASGGSAHRAQRKADLKLFGHRRTPGVRLEFGADINAGLNAATYNNFGAAGLMLRFALVDAHGVELPTSPIARSPGPITGWRAGQGFRSVGPLLSRTLTDPQVLD